MNEKVKGSRLSTTVT